jgi:hypothetical protein
MKKTDLNKAAVFPVAQEDRIIAGFVAVGEEPERWDIIQLAVERTNGSRWCRGRLKDSTGAKQVYDIPIDGKTDEQVAALAEDFLQAMEEEGRAVVMAVRMTDCNIGDFLKAMQESDYLSVHIFELGKKPSPTT